MADPNLTALRRELTAKGIKYCIGAYVDLHGVPKGKVVPVSHFEHFASGSELYTGYALDGLGQKPNDDEIASVPDLSRGVALPWQPEVMWYPADLTFHGEPYPVSTRVALKNVIAQARAMGYDFNLGIECEVYFLKQEGGRLVVPNPDDNLVKSCYDLKRFFDAYGLVDRIATSINDLGWDLYSFDHEDGNSQFEFDFKYADALTMADRFIFFRLLAKKYAADAGLLATFMPKPFADKTGNGAHFNMSLADTTHGKNLFQGAPGDDPCGIGISQTGLHFIGGILKHGRALCAAFAPTVNSYKRLIKKGAMGYYSWAPVFNSFGTNNRTNSVRVPMGGAAASPATPIPPAIPTSPAPSSSRPVWKASGKRSTPVPPNRKISTNSATPNSPPAASSACPAPWQKPSMPSKPIPSWKPPWAMNCVMNSSP